MRRYNFIIVFLLIAMSVSLVNAAVITGQVKAANTGTVVAGAEIKVIGLRGAVNDTLVLTAVTNNEGRYTVTVPAPGIFYVKASKAGYQPASQGPFTITDPNATLTVNFSLASNTVGTGTVKGTVLKQSVGAVLPLMGAMIKLTGASTTPVYVAVSDSLGKFVINNVPYGIYLATCEAVGFQPQQLTVTVQQPVTELTITMIAVSPTAASVSGFVYDDSTLAPLGGVTLTLAYNTPITPPVLVATSTNTGSYKFENVPSGTYTLIAQREGYNSYSHAAPLVIANGTIITNLKIYMHKTVTAGNSLVRGKVVAATPAGTTLAIAGARISLTGSILPITFTGISDSLGLYTIPNVPYGAYLATCQAPGYAMVSKQITIQSAITELSFTLQRNVTISGRLSGKVIDDSLQTPIKGVLLVMSGTIPTFAPITATSDSTGKFVFENLIPDTYQLSAQREGYATYQHPTPIVIDSGTVITNLIVPMHKINTTGVAVVKGFVYKNISAGIVPIPGAIITLARANGAVFTTHSDSAGAFKFSSVPFGTYVAKCSAAGYETITKELTIQTAVFEYRFYMNPVNTNGLTVNGVVYDDSTHTPIGGATITLNPNGILPFLLTATTTEFGSFTFTNVPPGTYQMTAVKTGYVNYVHPQLIHVDSGIVNNYVINMKRIITTGFATVKGIVYNKYVPNTIIAGAVVKLVHDSTYYTAVTDNTGKYVIHNVEYGIYRASCSAQGFLPVSTELAVQANVVEFPFYLMPSVTPGMAVIKGKVYFDGTNAPVKGAVINLMPNVSTGTSVAAITDNEGKYSAIVAPGNYIIMCRFEIAGSNYSYKEYWDNVQNISQATVVPVQANDTIVGINFGIPSVPIGTTAHITLKGRVADNANHYLAGAVVNVIFPMRNDSSSFSAVTNAEGGYSITMEISRADSSRHVFVVLANKSGYKTEFYLEKPSLAQADKFFVLGDTNYANINFTLEPVAVGVLYSISGKVTGTAGIPLSGAFVIGANAQTSEISFAFTSATGNYLLANLKQGKYYLLFAATGYIPEFYNNVLRWENATPIIVNTNVANINAELQAAPAPSGSAQAITGVISDASGTGIGDVLVVVNDQSNNVINYSFSDAFGTYEIPGIPQGYLIITATKVGYGTYSQTLNYDPQSGNTIMHNITLAASPTDVKDEHTTAAPSEFKLMDCYPNPFNPSTVITYQLPQESFVSLVVYDALGNEVQTLVSEMKTAGVHTVAFNAANLHSGVYFCTMRAGEYTAAKKLLLMK